MPTKNPSIHTPPRGLSPKDTIKTNSSSTKEWTPVFSKWRHGGWYVDNVRYPSGACGCVSNNYIDKKWRIACDERPFDQAPTFKTRDAAARAEYQIAKTEGGKP